MRSFLVGLALALPAVCSAQEQQWGSLEGRVTLKGKVPAVLDLTPRLEKAGEIASCCLAGKPFEKVDPTWTVDAKTKGVANVFVFLSSAPGQRFPIHEQDKVRKTPAVIDQPHCAFVPHVLAHYPAYRDEAGRFVPTGERFLIKNSAPVAHNARGFGDPLRNPAFNFNLPPGKEKEITLKSQRMPLIVDCNMHPWMNARIMIFDHPYFAVTKADGSFTIPRVPVGANITLMAWHEAVGWVVGPAGRPVALKAGKNQENFEIPSPVPD